MNRNVESHFATLPHADIQRSTFDRDCDIKLTFNAGDLVPFYVDEVLPGDTFQIKTSKVVRMQSLITPIMDNMYLDTYFFYVPNRLVWEHWREFMGENTQSAWIPQASYSVPQLTSPASTGWTKGTIADYLGIPTGVAGLSVNALPFRAYALIADQWFRDENLTDPLSIPVTDSTVAGVNTGNYISDTAKGGLPFKVSKYHDYFTSALPEPQKGPAVTLPVAAGGVFPVVATSDSHDPGDASILFHNLETADPVNDAYARTLHSNSKMSGFSFQESDGDHTLQLGGYRTTPINLWAMDVNPQAATINQLRIAFQIQKFYEKDSRSGSRYIELLRSHFGVSSPDARLQRAEYLGGNRVPVNINQIVQQSETGTTPQGTPTGLSLTTDVHGDFIKSFTEHGFVIGVCCVRYDHTYQQGLEKFWSREDKFDYYWPVFANIGETAILNKEIYAQGSSVVDSDGNVVDDQVFGYQEAWADYRYKPNRTAGEMRSQYSASLDVWHLGDDYSQLPTLSDAWIREDSTNVDRVIAVSQQNADQFFADIFVMNRATRPMPMYSIPGLIDHH